MSGRKALLQNVEDDLAQVFRCRHVRREFLTSIQILVIEAFKNSTLYRRDQAPTRLQTIPVFGSTLAADRNLERVVVSVPVRIVALAIGGAVLRIREPIAM